MESAVLTEVEQALCRAYELGRIAACQPSGGTRSQSFLLQTDSGEWFARKRHHGYSAPDRVAFDHAAIAFLHDNGVAVVMPRRTLDGHSLFVHDGDLWEVFPALPNRPFREGDLGDIRLLGRALTQFHLCGRAFPGRYDKLGPRGETSPVAMNDIAVAIKSETPECAASVQMYERWISTAAADLSADAYAALPHTLVHGDVHPANILMDSGRVAAFVDLDWCAWRPRVYDLAFAILLCCSSHDSPIRGGDIWRLTQPPSVQQDCVQEFLRACADEGWPLEPCEANALRAQVMLSWCHCRLAGALKVEPPRRNEFLSRPPSDAASLFPSAVV